MATPDSVLAQLSLQLKEVPLPEPEKNAVTVADKATFVAHLVSGRPFTKNYRLLDGAAVLQFESLSTVEYEAIRALHIKDDRYTIPEMVALGSLKTVQFQGGEMAAFQDQAWTTTRHANAFLLTISDIQYQLILDTYSKFEQLFYSLLQASDSAAFAQDPAVAATLTAISQGVLNPGTMDGSARWYLAVKLALSFVSKIDVTADAANISDEDKASMADKWRKLNMSRKI